MSERSPGLRLPRWERRTLAPAFWLMERMRLSGKMALIGALFLAPAIWLAFTHYRTLRAQIEFSASELRGLPMVTAAGRVMQPLQRCRGLRQQRLRGLPVPQDRLQACEVATTEALQVLSRLQAQSDDLLPGGSALVQAMHGRWQVLRTGADTASPDANFAAYSALVGQLVDYVHSVADHSNLTLDIEVDSYYLMESVTVHLPEQIEAAAALRGYASARMGPVPLTEAERTQLAVLMHDLDQATERVHQDISRLADAIPRTRSLLGALDSAQAAMLAELQRGLLDAAPASGSAKDLFDRGTVLVDAGYAALNEFSTLLEQRLEHRLARIRQEMAWQFSVLGVLLVVALALAKATHASALHSVAGVAAAARRIASGDFSRPIAVRGADELSQLAQSVNELQQRLALTLEAERLLLSDNQRINGELMAANERLESKVAQRTEEIRHAHAELRLAMDQVVQTEKLASLGKLVATVSHEVSTPIGVILTVASTLQAQFEQLQQLHEQGQMRKSDLARLLTGAPDTLALVVNNAQRVGQLLKTFDRVRVDGTGLQHVQFRLLPLCRDVVTLMKPALKIEAITVELEVAEELMLDGIPDHLQQVLQNLVQNTLDHAFETAGTGRVIRIAASATTDGHGKREVLLDYSDNGHGLRGVDPKRLFEPFYATQLGHGVRGLGLYIVHTLVYGSLQGSLALGALDPLDPQEPGFHISLRLPAAPA